MKQKIFLRAYCHSNLGDDLFIHIICRRYPDVDFYMMADASAAVGFEALTNLHIVKRNVWIRLLDKLGRIFLKRPAYTCSLAGRCDAVVMIGGSMFIEDEAEKWRGRLSELKLLRKAAKRFFIAAANFGEYHTEEFRRIHEEFFADCDDVCFRDHESEQLFPNLPNIRYAPDIVFGLDAEGVQTEDGRRQLALIPIRLNDRKKLSAFTEDYVAKMAALTDDFMDKGWRAVLISFCGEQGDEAVISDIMGRMSAKNAAAVQSVHYDGRIEQPLNAIAQSEIIVTSRFHGMILGWLYHKKVFPVIYDRKMTNIIQDLKLSGPVTDIADFPKVSFDDIAQTDGSVDAAELGRLSGGHFAKLDEFLQKNQ